MKEVQIGPCTLINADCLEALPTIGGVHSCCTDPPYHLTSIVKRFGAENAAPAKEGKTGAYARASKGFMGQQWDGGDIAFRPDLWALVGSALRPGGHLAAFSGSRTYHRMACAIEDGGFDMRDMLMWIYGSGFPKSHDVSKGIDRAAGAKRKVIGKHPNPAGNAVLGWGNEGTDNWRENYDADRCVLTAPATPEAQQWQGWGSSLKPAHEPIAFARKPLSESSIASNVLKHGTGAINVDAGRVATDEKANPRSDTRTTIDGWGMSGGGAGSGATHDGGRWPANVITDGSLEVYELFPPSARDSIRFFYSAKAGADEREFGMGDAGLKRAGVMDGNHIGGKKSRRGGDGSTIETPMRSNNHPTVKPVDLMRWLCRLITPPGGIILDPFMGSGSTGIAAVREGFRFIGIEQSPEYFEIAVRRIEAAVKQSEREPDLLRPKVESAQQLSLLEG